MLLKTQDGTDECGMRVKKRWGGVGWMGSGDSDDTTLFMRLSDLQEVDE